MLNGKAHRVKLFMDESGNGHPSEHLIVGAVELGDDADDIEEQIRVLHRTLCARRSFIGHRNYEKFRKNGFHSSEDPQDVSAPFLELIRTFFFRTYMVTTDRTGVLGATEAEQIEFMYVKLLSDLLLRYRRKPELLCYIEQSEGMGSIIRRLPESAAIRAYETLGKRAPLPELKIEMVAKADYMSTAIVDYVMAAVARWFREGCTTNPREHACRAFREIEPFISVLYSFEQGRISSRKDPLH
jgi:hypothetical protein